MAKDVASRDLDGLPQEAHHQRLCSWEKNTRVDCKLRFVQRRQAATFQSHVESSIDPVDDPALSLDSGRAAFLQQQLLNIENHQTWSNDK